MRLTLLYTIVVAYVLLQSDFLSADVVDLTSATFEGFIKNQTRPVYVIFYSPWSRISNRILPVFSQLDVLNITLARVNIIDEMLLYETQYLAETPTCKLYRYGQSEIYAGEYSIDSMAWWIQDKLGGAKSIILLQNYEHLRKLKDLHESVIVGNFKNNTTKDYEIFSAMPTLFSDTQIIFAATFNNTILVNNNITELWKNETTNSKITIFNQKSNFTWASNPAKNLTISALKRWIKKNVIQPVKWVSFSEADHIFETKPTIILFMNPPLPYQHKPNIIINPKPVIAAGGLNASFNIPHDRIEALHALYSVAHDYKGKLNFGLMDARRSEYFKDSLGAIEPGSISFVFLDLEKKHNKLFSGVVSENELKLFIDQQLSLNTSTIDNITPVNIKDTQALLTADQIASVYRSINEPTLILLTLNWCGHCKRMWPVFWSIEKQFELVNFRYFDVAKDDLPPSLRHIEYFPTIILLQVDTCPIVYKGISDKSHLIQFLQTNLNLN